MSTNTFKLFQSLADENCFWKLQCDESNVKFQSIVILRRLYYLIINKRGLLTIVKRTNMLLLILGISWKPFLENVLCNLDISNCKSSDPQKMNQKSSNYTQYIINKISRALWNTAKESKEVCPHTTDPFFHLGFNRKCVSILWPSSERSRNCLALKRGRKAACKDQ
jgi:hypothetical protein